VATITEKGYAAESSLSEASMSSAASSKGPLAMGIGKTGVARRVDGWHGIDLAREPS
jgi:hypothetical protein